MKKDLVKESQAFQSHFMDDQANDQLCHDIRSTLLQSEIEKAELACLKCTYENLLSSLEKEIKKVSKLRKAMQSRLIDMMTEDQKIEYVRLYAFSDSADQFIAEECNKELIMMYASAKTLDSIENKLKTLHLSKSVTSDIAIKKAMQDLIENRVSLANVYSILKK
jgi:hypothetical protein